MTANPCEAAHYGGSDREWKDAQIRASCFRTGQPKEKCRWRLRDGALHAAGGAAVVRVRFRALSVAEQHQTIRDFQSPEPAGEAKVIVLTVRAGAVGITLTAATRIYLLEPALNPSAEVQMAGRIHRLGQTRGVLIKRLCYKESIDMAIDQLHADVQAGKYRFFDDKMPAAAVATLMTSDSGERQ